MATHWWERREEGNKCRSSHCTVTKGHVSSNYCGRQRNGDLRCKWSTPYAPRCDTKRAEEVGGQGNGHPEKTIAKKIFGEGEDQVLERHQEWSRIKKTSKSAAKKKKVAATPKQGKVTFSKSTKKENATPNMTRKMNSTKKVPDSWVGSGGVVKTRRAIRHWIGT